MIVLLLVLVVVVVLVWKRAHRPVRRITRQSVAHVMQLPELDGPRYSRRSGKRRHRATDGRP